MAAPEAKWPRPGQRLPVTVDRAHPGRVVIRWAEVPAGRDLAMNEARPAEALLRTGIDPAVLAEAIAQVDGPAQAIGDPAADPDVIRPVRHRPVRHRPRSPNRRTIRTGGHAGRPGRPATPPAATVPATGTVVAVREVQMPAGFGPAGGVADLTIQLTDGEGTRTAVARTSFGTPDERVRVAVVGTTVPVLLDPANPHAVTIRLPE